MTANLYSLIHSRLAAAPDRPVIETATRPWRWRDVDATTARYARLLADLGCRPGDRVAVQAEKSPESLFVYLACLRSGLVYLPMNTAYQADEVDYLIGNARPAVVLASPAVAGTARTAAARHGAPPVLTLTADGGGTFPAAADAVSADGPMETVGGGDDVAAILYTSGTTGRPKGAMLSHRNLAANGEALRVSWRFTDADVLLHALPLFHAHGLFVACHCVLLSGARMIWHPGFDRERVIRDLPRASVFMGVPTFYTRLLAGADLTADVCRGIRVFISGSAPLLAETFAAFRARTGHAILERYGMTETGMNTSNPYDGERRAGTVGVPLPGVSVRVAAEDGRTLLPTGAVGILHVKGDNVFSGYWRMPEKTAEDFTADGWFITGDLALLDDRGVVHLVGRAKDLIISGGYNVYPKEVETVIDALPGVVESAVIGLPHPDYGEAVIAVVRRGDGGAGDDLSSEAIIAAVRERLANYKVPKRVIFVDDLPRNAMGKVQKNILRQTHAGVFAYTPSA